MRFSTCMVFGMAVLALALAIKGQPYEYVVTWGLLWVVIDKVEGGREG